jgi:hypothetical protein
VGLDLQTFEILACGAEAGTNLADRIGGIGILRRIYLLPQREAGFLKVGHKG